MENNTFKNKLEEREMVDLENKEGFDHNLVTLICLRHGETKYLEDYTSDEEKEKMQGKYPLDLTEKGEADVRKKAQEILTKIDTQNDLVVLWGSPAWRAQGSEKIIEEELTKGGVSILKDKKIDFLMHMKMYDKEYALSVWKKIKDEGNSTDWIYAYDKDFKSISEIEQISETKKRAESFFHYIQYLAKHIDLKEKRLVIISVSHFEVLNPIVDDIFGKREKSGQKEIIKKGEELVFNFDYDKKGDHMNINALFRGEKRENIIFDKEKRHFRVEEK